MSFIKTYGKMLKLQYKSNLGTNHKNPCQFYMSSKGISRYRIHYTVNNDIILQTSFVP